jgi:hypothetical protein
LRRCKTCGFPLDTRPGLKEKDGVCLACINNDKKKDIDFKERQRWLTKLIKEKKSGKYDCLIAVSGGKDSHMIVKRLIENHGVKNPLLVSVTDEFTHTKAGKHNIDNLVNLYDLDLITFRCKPNTFKKETLKDFKESLHPLKWIEERIYDIPVEVAKNYKIPLVFYGENSAFEYGTSEELEIFHPASDNETSIIFMGAIYPYSITDSLAQAKEIGFKDLDDFCEWPRQGSIEQYTQIDSIAYIIQLWTKFVKFGFQRVSDIACRLVREGIYTKDQALIYIDMYDYICDPTARGDFCNAIGITRKEFDDIVDKHANKKLVEKVNGEWKTRKA